MLDAKIQFGKWDIGPELLFAGGRVEQSLRACAAALTFEKYPRAAKPIAVEKPRRSNPVSALSPKEMANLRTLNGQWQWPAAQGVIIAAASASFRAADAANVTAQALRDTNEDLRFLKSNADVGLHFDFAKPRGAPPSGGPLRRELGEPPRRGPPG